MRTFLDNIARQYKAHYHDNLSDICFVFPNKRSGTFFTKYLRDANDRRKYMPMPGVTTFSSLVEEISGRAVDNRINLLFILFNCYKKVLGISENDPRASIDKFRTWGEMVLSDFDDVDRYGVDPAMIFKNVNDFHNIATNYFTDEQIKSIKEVFGVDIDTYPGKFWITFYKKPYKAYNEDDDNAEHINVRGYFMHLWQILHPLYIEFNKALDTKGITYQGGAYKIARDLIADKDNPTVLPYKKFVFVGFYNISKLERDIFDNLRKRMATTCIGEEPMADFVWDITGPASFDARNEEMKFMQQNLKDYPAPDWLDMQESNSDTLPEEINIISCPSNSMQAKEVGRLIDGIAENSDNRKLINNAKIAVVLPDENLLLPLLYSLPKNGKVPINLTMGYPLKLSSVVSLVKIIRRMQHNLRRTAEKEVTVYYQDLKNIISHPIIQDFLGSEIIIKIKDDVLRKRLFRVKQSELAAISEDLTIIFNPVLPTCDDAFKYLRTLMDTIRRRMDVGMRSERLDISHIEFYLNALQRLENAMSENGVTMGSDMVFLLAERLISGEHVSFRGEPVHGLQIVGLLETRCLDFDAIIVPSMNERIFPQRLRNKSFIPSNLRFAYGLPTVKQKERAYSYLFYRMISRAKKVTFLYDSRNPDGHHGDISRYLLQLKHLYAPNIVKESELSFNIHSYSPPAFTIPKNEAVMQSLREYFNPQLKRNLSASTLQKYIECPLKFYFASIQKLRDDPDPTEYLSAADTGIIFHDVLSQVFLMGERSKEGVLMDNNPIVVKRQYLENLIADDCRLLREMLDNAIENFYKNKGGGSEILPGDVEALKEPLLYQLKKVIEYDMTYGDIRILGCEVKDVFHYNHKTLGEINVKYIIDRVDIVDINGCPTLRVVDYKSGSVHLEASTIPQLFINSAENRNGNKNLLQLMLYSMCLDMHHPGLMDKLGTDGIRMEIYSPTGSLKEGVSHVPSIKDENGKSRTVNTHKEIQESFSEGFDTLLSEIFDPSVSFTQTDETVTCQMCNFRNICRKG